MIQIKTIEIEGFCSIVEPFSYNFDLPGINMIWGRNGAGKSTIFNALSWCLYGKLLKPKRSIIPWKNLQNKSFGGTMVKVKFYVEGSGYYDIMRCKDYRGFSDLTFYTKSGNEFNGRKKSEIEKEIQRVLGVSFELFKSSVTFGQNLTRFLKLPSGGQKEILDEAFSINYINEARENAKKGRALLETDRVELEINLSKLNSEYSLIKNNLKEVELLKKNFDRDKNRRLKELRDEIRKVKVSINTFIENKRKKSEISSLMAINEANIAHLETEMITYNKLSNRIFEEDFEISNAEAHLRELINKRKEKKILLSNPKNTCFRCGQEINKQKKQEQRELLRIDIRDLGNEIIKCKEAIDYKKNNLKQLKKKFEMASSIKNKYEDAQKKFNTLKNTKIAFGNVSENLGLAKKNKNQLISKLRETLQLRFGYKIENQRKKLLNLKVKIGDIDFRYQKIKKEIKLHDWVINDPLSNRGIKAYIFSLMIQKINHKLNEYGRKVGFGIKLSIDLESANKTFNAEISKGNEIISYDDLSGGEEQLVDACLAFSMNDVISNNKFNILLLDEVFESLDKDNIDLIYEMIDFKAKSTNVHLISHRKSFISRANAVIEL